MRQRTGISTQHRIPDTINQSGSHDWLCTCTRWREKAIDAASGSDEGKESNSVRWEREINECARMNKKKKRKKEGPGAISRRQETQMGVVGDSGLPPSCRPSLHTRTDPAGSCAVALLCVHASLRRTIREGESEDDEEVWLDFNFESIAFSLSLCLASLPSSFPSPFSPSFLPRSILRTTAATSSCLSFALSSSSSSLVPSTFRAAF